MKIEYLKGGANVISIAPARTQQQFPAISQVEAYWEGGLRNGRLMPTRSEVDPRGISDILEFAFVLEKIAPGMARIRLAGMHLNDLMGMEVRGGMPLTAMFLPEARRQIQRTLELVFERPPSTARLTLSGDRGGMTRPALDAQLFLAPPLKGEDGKPNRILGALQANGKIGRAPRRFTVRESEINALVDDAPPLTPPREAAELNIPGFAEHARGFGHTPVAPKTEDKSKRGAHLRLVADND